MKTLVLALLIATSSFAGNNERKLNRVFKCLTKNITKQVNGRKTIDQSYEILKKLRVDGNHKAALQACKELRQDETNNKTYMGHRDLTKYSLEFYEKHKDAEAQIVHLMASYQAQCKLAGFDFNVGVVYSFGIGAKIGTCTTNLGNSFTTIVPSLLKGAGAGVSLLFNVHNVGYSFTDNLDDYGLVLGQGYVAAWDEDESDRKSYGLGINWFIGSRYIHVLKIVPVRGKMTTLLSIW